MTPAFDYPEPFDRDEEDPVSQRVIERVAKVTDTDPLELDPLYESVDPDCLDGIFENQSTTPGRGGGHIEFPMAGCQVTVEADGTIDVTSVEEQTQSTASSKLNTSTEVPESPD